LKILTLLIFAVLSITVNAQQNRVFPQEKYDSLKLRKAQLLEEKKELSASIQKNEEILESLKRKVDEAYSEVYIKKYGRDIGQRISLKQVWKGMTDKMLNDSWGKPDKITKNVEKWGVFTQWYYGAITYFFRDGKLTDWEDSSDK
jgi:hypothetical protein